MYARLYHVFKSGVVRSAMVYGAEPAETWALNKAHDRKLDLAKVNDFFRWMCRRY